MKKILLVLLAMVVLGCQVETPATKAAKAQAAKAQKKESKEELEARLKQGREMVRQHYLSNISNPQLGMAQHEFGIGLIDGFSLLSKNTTPYGTTEMWDYKDQDKRKVFTFHNNKLVSIYEQPL